jgi:hypothetical protein
VTDSDIKRLPRDKLDVVQLAFESLNDWHIEDVLADKKRPWYFSALVFCWFATLATGFEFSREYLLWLPALAHRQAWNRSHLVRRDQLLPALRQYFQAKAGA